MTAQRCVRSEGSEVEPLLTKNDDVVGPDGDVFFKFPFFHDIIEVHAFASETARTIVARLYGAEPATLRWNQQAQASTGRLQIPPGLPPGQYKIKVTAEDMAHNISAEEATLNVIP